MTSPLISPLTLKFTSPSTIMLNLLLTFTSPLTTGQSGWHSLKTLQLNFRFAGYFSIPAMLLILIVLWGSGMNAQPVLYAAYPPQDVRFHQAGIDISINRNATEISGTVNYEISAYTPDTPFIRLHARDMTISGITLDGNELDFVISAGRLTIDTEARLDTGRRYRLEITYEASPAYGIHVNERGTVWTSNMPGTTSAWVPALDTPFLAIPVNLEFTISDDLELMSVGEFAGSQPAGEGSRKVSWNSNVAVAVSDWNFAMGDLNFEEAIAGIKPVRLYTEPGTLDAGRRNQILRRVSDALGRTQRSLSMEFPFDGLNLLVLGDHRWEEKPFASGYGYLFLNLGDPPVQADRIVLHQWFGARQRSFEKSTAAVHQYFAAWIYKQLRDEDGTLEISEYPAAGDNTRSFYGPAGWNEALRVWGAEPQDLLSEFFRQSNQQAARLPAGVYDWNTYNRFIYGQTGTTFSSIEFDIRDESDKSIPAYEIVITEDEAGGSVSFSISPLHNVPDTTVRISMELISTGSAEQATLELEPAGGHISRSVDASLENITFETEGRVELSIEKPFRFWLHQLRRHDDAGQRTEAALAMARFTGDPDMQLALNDVIRNEEHPDVRAGLVRAMSAVTRGASGTEQMFMNFLREEPMQIQMTALDALSAYPGSDEVQRMTSRTAQTATDTRLAITALTSYRMIAGSSEFRDFVRRIMISDRPPTVKAAAIEELFLAIDTDEAAGIARGYLSGSQPYAVREAAFNLITEHAVGGDRESLILSHAGDRDPRMRLRALQAAISYLEGAEFFDLIETRKRSEHDYRIRNVLDGI